jgi:hypothetical protein
VGLSRERLAETPRVAWRGLREAGHASWSTRLEYLKVLAVASVTEVALRRVPLVRLARLYGVTFVAEPPAVAPLDDVPAWAARRLRVVGRVMGRWPVNGTCLRHALVAGQRVRALQPELKLGVAKDDTGAVVAHAWLVIGGKSLDPSSGRFAELQVPGN